LYVFIQIYQNIKFSHEIGFHILENSYQYFSNLAIQNWTCYCAFAICLLAYLFELSVTCLVCLSPLKKSCCKYNCNVFYWCIPIHNWLQLEISRRG